MRVLAFYLYVAQQKLMEAEEKIVRKHCEYHNLNLSADTTEERDRTHQNQSVTRFVALLLSVCVVSKGQFPCIGTEKQTSNIIFINYKCLDVMEIRKQEKAERLAFKSKEDRYEFWFTFSPHKLQQILYIPTSV